MAKLLFLRLHCLDLLLHHFELTGQLIPSLWNARIKVGMPSEESMSFKETRALKSV